jgi:hypothetical protein
MKTTMLVAIILMALGFVSLAYQGFSYTTKEKVVDIGPIQVDAEKTKTVPLPPILGGLALAGGIGLMVMSRKG